MNDEFETINNRIPDLSTALAQRIAAKQVGNPTPFPSYKFDPYKMMVQKKKEETEEIDQSKVVKWPDKDVKRLQDYCQRMGITGFSAGKMNPMAALRMLKDKFGEDYTDVPLEERVPEGYEKLGTNNMYNRNHPYSEAMKEKQILHG